MRKLRGLNLVFVFMLVLGVAISTMALAPQNGIGHCFGSPPDAKDEDGSDGWDIYAPPGYVFTEANVKAATECFDGSEGKYLITGIGTNHVHAERLCQEGPDCHEISHLEGNWELDQPTCDQTYVVVGQWSPWTVDPQDPTRECRYRDWTYYDVDFPDHVCNVVPEPDCRDIPQPGDPSLYTSSNCVDETTMEYETTISMPADAGFSSGDLYVLWYYPNGLPFVSGPTFLGTVPLSAGDNVFYSTMTQAELIAAIGANNLSGGNPVNDVNYDVLSLYTYEVFLVVGDRGEWHSNFDYLWENCYEGNGGCCKCPTCGPPQYEESPAIGWIGTEPCTNQNCEQWHETYVPWVIIWYTEVDAASMTLQQTGEEIVFDNFPTALEGLTCTMYMGRDTGDVGDQILWGPDGYGDRIRDHLVDGHLNHYSMCSLEPGWCPNTVLIDGVGYFRVLPGTFEDRIYAFLINNGFFPDLEGFERREAARAWAEETYDAGSLYLRTHNWQGDLSELPVFELPPR